MSQPSPYKTLFRLTLRQKSAFSSGGITGDTRLDSPLARDYKGTPLLRGTSIAGALVADARRFCKDENLLARVSEGTPGEQAARQANRGSSIQRSSQRRLRESIWRTHNARPTRHNSDDFQVTSEVRSGVSIDHFTGAALEGALWTTETLPAGTLWHILLECDDYLDFDPASSEGGANRSGDSVDHKARELLVQTLWFWTEHGALFGRDVARGMGWMHIEALECWTLDQAAVAYWPNTHAVSTSEALSHLKKVITDSEHNQSSKYAVAKDKQAIKSLLSESNDLTPVDNLELISGHVDIYVGTSTKHDKPEDMPWGLDTLSVAGNETQRMLQDRYLSQHAYMIPSHIDNMNRDTDTILALTEREGEIVPHIPGSSLRGPMRHALITLSSYGASDAEYDRAEEIGATTQYDTAINELFGSIEKSAQLLLSDALPEGPEIARIMRFEHHAEDEFSAGPYEHAKFDRLALFSGQFRFHYRIEIAQSDESQKNKLKVLWEKLNVIGESHWLPIGGWRFRGHGWVQWRFNQSSSRGASIDA